MIRPLFARAMIALTVTVISTNYAVEQAKATLRITDLLAESNRLLATRNFDRGQAALQG